MYLSPKVFAGAAALLVGVVAPVGIWAAHEHTFYGHQPDAVPRVTQDEATAEIDRTVATPAAPRAEPFQMSAPTDRLPAGGAATPRTEADIQVPATAAAPAPEPPREAPSAAPLASPTPVPAPVIAAAVRCGAALCAPDQDCCNASCGICVPRGGTCTNKVCGRPEAPISVSCGQNTCNVGQVCCNRSCGICAAPGATCSRALCDGITTPRSVSCGMNTCNVGEVCCNASCGVCTKPGGSCKQDLCD